MHTAWVYTTGPNTFRKLYKQRLRWTYGFIQNARDYKYLFFNPKYGNVGLLTLPTGLILIFGVLFSVFFIFYRIINFIIRKYTEWRTVGILQPHFQFSFFYISTKAHIFLLVFIYLLMITLLLQAYKISDEKVRINKNMLLYFILYPFISPFWIIKSIYNSILSRTTSWR